MEQHHLKGFLVEAISSIQDPCELSQLTTVIRLDHTYSCISVKAQGLNGLEEHYMKNAAVLPDIRLAASSVDVCQQEEPVSIYGYRDMYFSVVEPMMKTLSLQLCAKTNDQTVHGRNGNTQLPFPSGDTAAFITESFSTPSRSFTPQIHVDIREEPLPEKPRKQKPRH